MCLEPVTLKFGHFAEGQVLLFLFLERRNISAKLKSSEQRPPRPIIVVLANVASSKQVPELKKKIEQIQETETVLVWKHVDPRCRQAAKHCV